MTTTYATERRAQPTNPVRTFAGSIVTAIVAGAIAIGGIVAAVVFGISPAPLNLYAGSTPANNGSVVVHPSPELKTLQEKLAQLNYYNGPIDGRSNPQMMQAITYLQRDAGLQQTGHMNTATWAALTTLLVEGNNQMQ
jgi:Putative peptidoglycan binding domain